MRILLRVHKPGRTHRSHTAEGEASRRPKTATTKGMEEEGMPTGTDPVTDKWVTGLMVVVIIKIMTTIQPTTTNPTIQTSTIQVELG